MNGSKHNLNQAIAAIKAKQIPRAREILKSVLRADPGFTDAWVLYARVAPTREQALDCLERALQLDPQHQIAGKLKQQILEASQPVSAPAPDPIPAAPPAPARAPSEGGSARPVPGRVERGATPRRSPSWLIWSAVVLLLGVLIAGGYALYQGSPSLPGLFATGPTPSVDELTEIINRNIAAANAEDVDGYMDTIHSESPLHEQTEEALRMAFSTYDLAYSISDLAIQSSNSKEASVHFLLTTRKLKGPTFRDNQVEGVFLMRPDEGRWRIYQQEILGVTYLD